MNKINIGTKVAPLGIPKCKLAANQIARAVLVDPNPQFKYVGWDEQRKVRVEVNQEAVVKYGFRPLTTYYYLIALLNTDRMGNVVPGPIEIQYLQLSENVNNDFADAIRNMSNFSSLQLNAVEKVTKQGVFSYVKPIPCDNIQLPQDVIDQVMRVRNNPQGIDAMWRIIDSSTSITLQAYENLLLQESQQGAALPPPAANPPIPQAPYSPMLQSPAPQIQPSQPAQQSYQPSPQPSQQAVQNFTVPDTNDFGVGEEFVGEDFDK